MLFKPMFEIDNAVLLVIDVQGNLAYKMHDRESLFHNINVLIKAADMLHIPVIHTEQVPDKIGHTINEIQIHPHHQPPITKVAFSCCGEKVFNQHLASLNRRQIIVAGIETHVCVVQTVFDLIRAEYSVQVVSDAVSSRSPENKEIAIQRVRAMGATITGMEMLITELIRTSEHERFRDILTLIR